MIPPVAAGFPMATLAIALVSGLVFCFPMVNSWLLYNRDLILPSQLWRAWTGPVVRYS